MEIFNWWNEFWKEPENLLELPNKILTKLGEGSDKKISSEHKFWKGSRIQKIIFLLAFYIVKFIQ